MKTGEIFTKVVFDREKQGAYALEVEARDGAPSARPNSNNQPNSGKPTLFPIISLGSKGGGEGIHCRSGQNRPQDASMVATKDGTLHRRLHRRLGWCSG